MKRNFLIFVFLFSVNIAYGQFNGKNYSISASYSYTTTAKLFLYPNSSDQILRNQFSPLEDMFSYVFEFRYKLLDPLFVGVRSGYMKKTSEFESVYLGSPIGVIPVKTTDGFVLIPVEISAYYVLPFSTDNFKFFMSGGLGFYFGEHVREIRGVTASNEKSEIDFGIQVGVGTEYLIFDFLSAKFEMFFRDPQYELTSKYSGDIIRANNAVYRIPKETFDSKVNVNGVAFSIGISYQF
ncbi:MAG: hypothetical protein K9J12_04060 [Melioribacteraceae bacterium]|nr:hypothetical protein [Melioribacteraceae bacterium]MCF8263253.1 hypothetical protein [Melioribacteraceae bacterium]MCF8412876.1 hypothetical protein [Melioribacteraceae bacterium]MCF8430693.1 hypothetical protein [Melioribacteraceae bacterium]